MAIADMPTKQKKDKPKKSKKFLEQQTSFLPDEHESEEAAQRRRAAETIRHKYRGVKVTISQMPYQRSFSDSQKREALSKFETDPDATSMSKKLFDAKEPAVQRVRAVIADIKRAISDSKYSLPHPDPGLRLLLEDRIPAFDARMKELVTELQVASRALAAELPQIRERQKVKLKDLYNEADYQFDPETAYHVEWRYVPLEVPSYLMRLSPEIVEREQAAVRQQFEEAARAKEQEMVEEMFGILDRLVERLSGVGENGKARIFRDDTAAAIFDVIDEADRQFNENSIGSDETRNAFAKLKEVVKAQDRDSLAGNLRGSEALRNDMRAKLAKVGESLLELSVVKPRRSVLRNRAEVIGKAS